jgi:putative spermidine/putrescine transport system substrate-binding protein
VRVTTDYYCCSLSKLIAQVESGRVTWDVAEVVTGADFQLGVKKGLFAKLDPKIVPLDQLPEGSHNEYGFQNEIYSSVIAWNTDEFPLDGEHPENLEDIFDTERFPGKRCLFNYPQYGATLEVALIADGVAPEDLYPLDIERALRKLDTIRDDIVWWDNGTKSIQYLIDGECSIGLTWNGRAFSRIKNDDVPVGMAWGNALIHTGYLAIPKGAPNMENAQALVASWILDKQGQLDYVSKVGYPTPIKGLLELTDFPEAVRPFIPVGENVKSATVADEDYYAENLDKIVDRFNEWLQS